jgi:hypothetical protein
VCQCNRPRTRRILHLHSHPLPPNPKIQNPKTCRPSLVKRVRIHSRRIQTSRLSCSRIEEREHSNTVFCRFNHPTFSIQHTTSKFNVHVRERAPCHIQHPVSNIQQAPIPYSTRMTSQSFEPNIHSNLRSDFITQIARRGLDYR